MGPRENIGLWPFVTWPAYGSLPSELGNTWVVMLAVTIAGGTCRRTPFLLLGMCLVGCGSCADGLHVQCMGPLRGGGMCTCVDACLALFRLRHSGGAVCRVVKRCSWFAEVPERNVTSFAEEGNLLQRMASLGEEYVLVSMPVWHCFGCCGIAVLQNAAL